MRDLTDPVLVWTDEQQAAFLRQVTGDRFAALWHLAATTNVGLRDLGSLRRPQVDIAIGALRVRSPRSATFASGTSNRMVPVEPATLEVVREHVTTWEHDRRSTFPDATHLFLRSDGRRVELEDVAAMFQIHCLRAGVPIVDPTAWAAVPEAAPPRQSARSSRLDMGRSGVSESGLVPNLRSM